MGTITLEQLQNEVYAWQKHNFPDAKPTSPVLGTAEELGELAETLLLGQAFVGRLAHATLKMDQGIRGTREQHLAKIEDAVADLIIFGTDVANRYHFNLAEVLTRVWGEVKLRDWARDPVTGGTRSGEVGTD